MLVEKILLESIIVFEILFALKFKTLILLLNDVSDIKKNVYINYY